MWAFGCTTYETLHIKPMFSGSVFQLINKIGNVELSAFVAECPVEFKRAIMQCFEVNPDNRPDALEFLEVVEALKFSMQRSSQQRFFDSPNLESNKMIQYI